MKKHILGLALVASISAFAQVRTEINTQLNFLETKDQVSENHLIELETFMTKLADMKQCKLSVIMAVGNGDKKQRGDAYTMLGIKRAESVRSVFAEKGISRNLIYTEGTSPKDKIQKKPGAVILNALFNCPENSANKCDTFLEPGVNKIVLNKSETDKIVDLALMSGATNNITEVSALLMSNNPCIEAAAKKSGRTIDEVSSLVLKQIAAMPAVEIQNYSEQEKNEFVNYVVMMFVFTQAN